MPGRGMPVYKVQPNGKTIYIPVQHFTGVEVAGGVIRSAGNGNPGFAELGTTGLMALKADAAGDDIMHSFKIPEDMDVTQPLWIRAIISTDQTTATDTFTMTCLYSARKIGAAEAAVTPATVLNTAIAAKTNEGTASARQRTAWGIIIGNTFLQDDIMDFLMEFDAFSGADPTTDVILLWAVEINYAQQFVS